MSFGSVTYFQCVKLNRDIICSQLEMPGKGGEVMAVGGLCGQYLHCEVHPQTNEGGKR